MEKKGHESPRVCVCIHTYAHACSKPACASFMHVYTYTSMRAHVRVLETMKGKFSAFKTWFGMNLTSSRSRSEPHFLTIKSHTWYLFKTQKIIRENIRFTRNNESKREFFTKHF